MNRRLVGGSIGSTNKFPSNFISRRRFRIPHELKQAAFHLPARYSAVHMYHTGIIIVLFGNRNILLYLFSYHNIPVNILMIFACFDADTRDSFIYSLFNSQPMPFILTIISVLYSSSIAWPKCRYSRNKLDIINPDSYLHF